MPKGGLGREGRAVEEKPLGDDFKRELKVILMRALALRFSSGLLSFTAVGAWLFVIIILWTGTVERPALWQALAVSWIAIILAAFFFFLFVLHPLVRTPGLGKLASEIEQRKDFKNIIVAAYEFSKDRRAERRYHPALTREVIRRAAQAIAPLRARFLFLDKKSMIFIPFAYGGLVVILFLAIFQPTLLFDATSRMLYPGRAAAVEHEANLFASPGDVTVLAGSDVEVAGLDFGGTTRPVILRFTRSAGFWKSTPTEEKELLSGATVLKKYAYTFRDLRGSVSYFFQSGERKSSTYRINVVHKPVVTELQVIRTSPAYTGEEPDTLRDGGGNIQALVGTQVSVEGRCNNFLSHAAVNLDLGEEVKKSIAFSGHTFSFDFLALQDGSYSILLEDTLHHRNEAPLVYSVDVYSDNPPSIDVLEPGADASLPRSSLVKVSFVAADDYGVASTSLFYRKVGGHDFDEKTIPLGDQSGRKEVAQSLVWDLGDMILFPGDVVEYYLQVEDNNVVTGPGVARSRVFRISVPTMAELYQKIKEEDARRSDLLEQSIREGEELKKRVEKLYREFTKTEELDWSQKKEVDKALEAQKRIRQKLEEVRESLDETLQSLSDNRMTSQKIGEKIEEISDLLEEINSEVLERYVEEMQKALSRMSREEIKKALENLNTSAEELLERLERTASLLKEIWKEQRMEELVRKSQDLMEDQKDLLDETAETDPGSESKMEELAKRQEELAKRAAELEEEVEQFAGELEDKEIASEVEKAAQQLSLGNVPRKMKSASKNLKKGKKESALEDQEEALESLVGLFTSMSACRSSMGNKKMARIGAQLQRIARQALRVSFKQEDFAGRLQEVSGSMEVEREARKLAAEQLSYYKAVEKLANEIHEISKKTLVISPVLIRAIGEALGDMSHSVFSIEQQKLLFSVLHAQRAVGSLNRATIEMLRSSSSCSSGGSGSLGMQALLEQLLSGEREMVQQTKEFFALQAFKEKLLQERQARMQRLAAAQRSLKKVAEEIQKTLEENGGLLGRMDKIVEEMESVIKDFESGSVGERTLEFEERILSRLLDAERSVHTRDYERKRESVTAGDLFSRASRTAVPRTPSWDLREEIRRAMKLKAPGEFEDLIRLYFRALSEEHSRIEGGAGN